MKLLRPPSGGSLALFALLATLAVASCGVYTAARLGTKRQVTITSVPSGAQVYYRGSSVGTTPVDYVFPTEIIEDREWASGRFIGGSCFWLVKAGYPPIIYDFPQVKQVDAARWLWSAYFPLIGKDSDVMYRMPCKLKVTLRSWSKVIEDLTELASRGDTEAQEAFAIELGKLIEISRVAGPEVPLPEEYEPLLAMLKEVARTVSRRFWDGKTLGVRGEKQKVAGALVQIGEPAAAALAGVLGSREVEKEQRWGVILVLAEYGSKAVNAVPAVVEAFEVVSGRLSIRETAERRGAVISGLRDRYGTCIGIDEPDSVAERTSGSISSGVAVRGKPQYSYEVSYDLHLSAYALRSITGEDFGDDAERWREWWRRKSTTGKEGE